jgi:hypothetical protein
MTDSAAVTPCCRADDKAQRIADPGSIEQGARISLALVGDAAHGHTGCNQRPEGLRHFRIQPARAKQIGLVAAVEGQ